MTETAHAVPAPEAATETAERVADIQISAKKKKPLIVDLVGVRYPIKTPKGAIAMVMAKKMQKSGEDIEGILNALTDWLKVAMGPTNAAKVMERLDDPNDDLDFDHIMDLLKAVTEKTSGGNPTT